MILPKKTDALHKAWLYRLLSSIADDTFLVSVLRFKGGTCAAMRGLLERFSIDLDFDLLDSSKVQETRRHLEHIFVDLGLKIDQKSRSVPQYFLKYPNQDGQRNTIQIDVTFPPAQNNEYEAVRFVDIDRILYCHTIPTMFANKLVALLDRYEKYGSIAGRDLFDIQTFFLKGFSYKPEIIEERTGKSVSAFLTALKKFIAKNVTQTIIDQDLNTLLPPEEFRKVRRILKEEVMRFL